MSIRIVFVDDEVNILQAMQRAFRSMREEWTMEFASSAAAALESLARAPADVIVSDMRMPGMDGWQLLAEVKKLYPQTVRLVLSGHADPSSVMRAVGTAQLYLAKLVYADAASLKKEMSNLGISAEDKKKRFDIDKKLVEKLKVAQPYWEKAEKMNPSDQEVLDTLYSIYTDLDLQDQIKRIDKRYKELGIEN